MSSSSYRSIMDPLASSHTAGSRTGKCLLVVFFALGLFCHSIVAIAVASDSGNLQGLPSRMREVTRVFRQVQQRNSNVMGVDGVSKDFLARLRIRGEKARQNDRIGSEGRAQAEVRPPAIGLRRVEGCTRTLEDDSPPRTWHTPNGQDDVPPVVAEGRSEQTKHKVRDLSTISGRVIVPDADRTSLATVGSETGSIILQQKFRVVKPRFRRRSLLQGDISPPGMWPDSDDDENQLSESVLLRGRRLMNK